MTAESWFCALAIGCIASAVLVVNNLRDIEQDEVAGKRTLSVRIGARGSRILFGVLMAVPFLVVGYLTLFYPLARLVFLVLLLAVPAVLITATAKTARELILALSLTGITALVYGLGLAAPRCRSDRRPRRRVVLGGARRRRRGGLGACCPQQRAATPRWRASRIIDSAKPMTAASTAESTGVAAQRVDHDERHGEQRGAAARVRDEREGEGVARTRP